jgi:hypothetical protein
MKSGSLGILLVILTCIALWVVNVIKFCQCDFEEPYKTEIIRGIGIPIAFVGVVIAPIDIGEEE